MGKLEELKKAIDDGIKNEKLLAMLPVEFDLDIYKFYFEAGIAVENNRLVETILSRVPVEHRGIFNQLCFDTLYKQLSKSNDTWLKTLGTMDVAELHDRKTGNNLLHAAVQGDLGDAIAFLLTGMDQSKKNLQKQIPFELACYLKHFKAMRALLTLDPNFTKHYQKKPRRAFPMLGWCLKSFSKEVIDLIILMMEKGVDPRERNILGETFFHLLPEISVDRAHVESIKKIISKADLSIKDGVGHTPLHRALDKEIFNWYLEMLSTQPGHFDLSELLEYTLSLGKEIYSQKIISYDSTACWKYDANGNCALQIAHKKKNHWIIKELLEHGANGEARDASGKKIYDDIVISMHSSYHDRWTKEEFESKREKTFFFWYKKSLEDKYFEVQQLLSLWKVEPSRTMEWDNTTKTILSEYRKIMIDLIEFIPTRIDILRKNIKNQTEVIGQYQELIGILNAITARKASYTHFKVYRERLEKMLVPEVKYILAYFQFLEEASKILSKGKALKNEMKAESDAKFSNLVQTKTENQPQLPSELYPSLDMLLGVTENPFTSPGFMLKTLSSSQPVNNANAEKCLIDFDSIPASSELTTSAPVMILPIQTELTPLIPTQRKEYSIPKEFDQKFEEEEKQKKREHDEFLKMLLERDAHQETLQQLGQLPPALTLLPPPPAYRPRVQNPQPTEEKRMELA